MLVEGRTATLQVCRSFSRHMPGENLQQAGLGDAGLAGEHDRLAVSCLGALPTRAQEFDLLRAAHQRCQSLTDRHLEAALGAARVQYLVHGERGRNPLQGLWPELPTRKQLLNEPPGHGTDEDRIGLHERLQPCRHIRRFPHG